MGCCRGLGGFVRREVRRVMIVGDVHLGARRLMGADTLIVGGWGTDKCSRDSRPTTCWW